MTENMYSCAKCGTHGCQFDDLTKTYPDCPSKEAEIQAKARELYDNEENRKIACNAALVEAEGYCRLTRIQEIMLFMNKCGYKRVGLAFCVGFMSEARTVTRILEHNGFEVVSVACKNGCHFKSGIGVGSDKTISGGEEVMCNPIGQALLLNEAKTDINVLLGLCVGHDTLVMKHSEAPVTVLAVKDRVTGHNPLAAVYLADGYYKKKLFPEK